MCHWNTVNWNCIIRKETLEEKLSEEEKHALSRLQKELSEQKKVELLFTDADLEKDITFFLSGHHVKPEECMLLATEPEEVAWAKKDADSDSDQLTIIGYEVPDFSKQMPLSNVDMLLLQELRGDQCELEMISGGCDKETHRRRFRTKLISMGMSGYDRILVEPSGIYDVDEFFDTLYDEPLNRWYEAGSVITILDAGLDEKLSEEEEYLLASEAANAGKIVLSKVQNVSEEKKEETIAHLNRTLEQAGCRRQFSDAEILQKNWDDLTEDDFKMLSECNYRSEDYRKLDFGEQQTFDSLCFLEPKITEEALKKAAEAIFADPSCGNVFRIKGIVKTGETEWSEINATREQMTFRAVPESQEVLIVIGAGLSKERISGILGIE